MSRKPASHIRRNEGQPSSFIRSHRSENSFAGFSIEASIGIASESRMPSHMFGRSNGGGGSRKPSTSVKSPYANSSPPTIATDNFYGNSSGTTPLTKPPTLALTHQPPSGSTSTSTSSSRRPSKPLSGRISGGRSQLDPREAQQPRQPQPLDFRPQHRDARGQHRPQQSRGHDPGSAITFDDDDDDSEDDRRATTSHAHSGPSSSPSLNLKRSRAPVHSRFSDDDQEEEEDRPAKRGNFSRSSPFGSESSRDPMDILPTPTDTRPSKRRAMLGKDPASTQRRKEPESPTNPPRSKTVSLSIVAIEVAGKATILRHQSPRIMRSSADPSLRLTWDDLEGATVAINVADLFRVFAPRQMATRGAPFLGIQTEPGTATTRQLQKRLTHYDPKQSGPHPPMVLWGNEEDRGEWYALGKAISMQASKSCSVEFLDENAAERALGTLDQVLSKKEQAAKNVEQRRASQSPKMATTKTFAPPSDTSRSRVMQPRARPRSPRSASADSNSPPPALDLLRRTSASASASANREEGSPAAGPSNAATYGSRNSARRASARLGGNSLKLPEREDSPSGILPSRPTRTTDSMKLRYPIEGPGSVSVFESDCDRLLDGEFLNDTIVEFGLKYHLNAIKKQRPTLFENLYVFNSFFYRQLHQTKKSVADCYQQVRKWTSKIDIFAKDYLVIPINENLHWYLAIVVNPGAALEARDSSAEPREMTPPAGATRSKAMSGRVSITRGNRTINSDASDGEAGPSTNDARPSTSNGPSTSVGKATAIDSRASTPGGGGDGPRSETAAAIARSYSALTIGGAHARAGSDDEIESEPSAAADTRLSFAQGESADPIEMTSQEGKLGTDSDEIQDSLPSKFPFAGGMLAGQTTLGEPPVLDLGAVNHPVIDLSNTQEGNESNRDVDMVDGSSNIANRGRGSLVGGGDAKRQPMRIVPGESMQRAMSFSPPLAPVSNPVPSGRPRPRPSVNHPGTGSRNNNAASGARANAASGARGSAASSSRVIIDVDSRARSPPMSSTPRTSPNVTKSAPAPRGKNAKRAEEVAQRLRGQLKEDLVVLTFDSLGGTHPSVTKAVNEYLRCEALDKRKIHITPQAKAVCVAVPEQSNFSDCGLYVLLYFERFFRNLQQFKEQIIPEKDKSSELWGAESASKARKEWRKRIEELSVEWKKKKEADDAAAEAKGGEAGAEEDDDDGFEEAGAPQESAKAGKAADERAAGEEGKVEKSTQEGSSKAADGDAGAAPANAEQADKSASASAPGSSIDSTLEAELARIESG